MEIRLEIISMSFCFDWNYSKTRRWCTFPSSRAYFEQPPTNPSQEFSWREWMFGLPKALCDATTWVSLGFPQRNATGDQHSPSFGSVAKRAMTILCNILSWECWWIDPLATTTM